MSVIRFIQFSALGMMAFFVPVDIFGRSTIIIDHLVTQIVYHTPGVAKSYVVLLILWGVFAPFLTKTWNTSRTTVVLSFLQSLALPLAVMYLTGIGPAAIMAPDMLPFLFDKLAVPVGLVVPIGAIFLTLLIGFGLLEAIGTIMEPVMRPLFKTPGRSAIDAVASFAGSYSVGLLITSRVYHSGMYTAREAAIIATGFSTVSVTFMVIVARTLSLSDIWNAYFVGALIVTFAVTAITVRMPPLSRFDNTGNFVDKVLEPGQPRILAAWRAGIHAARIAPGVWPQLKENVKDGLQMATRVVPSILSIGLLGLLAARYTPLFDVIGLLIAPVTWLIYPDNAVGASGVMASGLAEMFLPAVQASGMEPGIRYVIGVVSVSSILFLSASIPCILATGIPISVLQMLIIWLQRTMLSIPLAYVVGRLFGVIVA